MESRRYPTDLSDDEWRGISPHLPGPIAQGRPRLHCLRAILDAVFYILKSGCPWRMLPKDLERLGRPSTTGSGGGASTVRGNTLTPSCASVYGAALAETRTPAQAS